MNQNGIILCPTRGNCDATAEARYTDDTDVNDRFQQIRNVTTTEGIHNSAAVPTNVK